MADLVRVQTEGVPSTMKTRYEDMGDGTHALVISVDGSDVGLVAGTAVKFFDENDVVWGPRNVNGKLLTTSKDYLYDIAAGEVTGSYPVRKHGHNPDVGTSPETVSHIGAVMYYPPAAEILKIKSDDVDDDGAPVDTGARTVWLCGLDANYAIITDTITMNGTTAVDSNVAFLRLFEMNVVTAGTSLHNEGTITAYGNDGTSAIDAIAPEENISHSASFTVPAGQTLYLTSFHLADASLKGAEVSLYTHAFGGLWQNYRPYVLVDDIIAIPLDMPLTFAEKTDVEMRATALAAGAIIAAGFSGWRQDN